MDADDPEKRIAELERQLAEQKRIAELERQLAEAKAARQSQDAGQGADERARRYAESLWEGLRSGGPVGSAGPAEAEMAAHREAFMSAAAQAGLSQEQIDNIFKHGHATFRVGHSVVYSGQGAATDYGAPAGMGAQPGFSQQVGSKRQVASGRRRPWGMRGWPDRIGAIVGAIGICVGAAASLTATMPASALWTGPFVCDSGYQLAYNTSSYSYKPGQSGTSVDFECVGATGSYDASWFAIDAFQTLLVAGVLGVAVAIGYVIWRSFRKPE
ncbi:hypothetical protein [Mycobacterium sp. 852002-51057_SCH5723018]|uniref:hypothetical protein n=1 Tax=Mycobacterium sp. 852002-51057_SCH5723018 TaxID=1834094 RepID=UPI0007FFE41E|nr:hypothetical protein [Mycobacterium sp. 852002-51057_SCH5723018]OBG24547.1 hypothetical protein A5764_09050 [Mycobacterium sp. 852002-51057_SCH5723018]